MKNPKMTIIVAGGKGERMQTDIPKQFIEIQGKPILMHTIEAFTRFDVTMQIILVLPLSQIDFWKELCIKHDFKVIHQIVVGGKTRFESVRNGLTAVKSPVCVAVHDGVRPLVSTETIARCFDVAEQFGNAIPVVDLVDSIRQTTKNGSISVDRKAYKLVQTPQVFDADLLKNAYEQDFSEFFTDDASVVENLGTMINLVDGNRENIKITTSFDLLLAEVLINS
ncbi:MAG: 2-C-methyl-D-erythritol 4-phosphate cytidylyltransferase [Paludibacter sp.]